MWCARQKSILVCGEVGAGIFSSRAMTAEIRPEIAYRYRYHASKRDEPTTISLPIMCDNKERVAHGTGSGEIGFGDPQTAALDVALSIKEPHPARIPVSVN